MVIQLQEHFEKIPISSSTISLGQFLKLTNYFSSGGEIKNYIQNYGVFVNDEIETRRGRKLQINDIVQLEDGTGFIVTYDEDL